MKKLAALILLVILCSSCTNNDNNTNDKIIGDWVLIELSQSGLAIPYDACWEYSIITFTETNTVLSSVVNNPPANCEFGISDLQRWERTGNNSYEIGDDISVNSNAYFDGGFLIVEDNSNYKRKHARH